MKKIIITALVLLLSTTILVAQNNMDDKKIAIFPFRGDGIDTEDQGDAYAAQFTESLLAYNYTLVSRTSAISQALAEIDIQNSGLTDGAITDYGKQLGADYVLSGNMVRLGSIYLVKVEIIDTSSAQIGASTTITVSRPSEILSNKQLAVNMVRTLDSQITAPKKAIITRDNSEAGKIAIFPFSGNGVSSKEEGDAFAGLFTKDLVTLGYTLITRTSAVENTMLEIDLQQSGMTEEIQAEYGKQLGAEFVLSGQVVEIDRYSRNITVQVIEVNTSVIKATVTHFVDDIEDFINNTRKITEMVAQLNNSIASDSVSIAQIEKIEQVQIETPTEIVEEKEVIQPLPEVTIEPIQKKKEGTGIGGAIVGRTISNITALLGCTLTALTLPEYLITLDTINMYGDYYSDDSTYLKTLKENNEIMLISAIVGGSVAVVSLISSSAFNSAIKAASKSADISVSPLVQVAYEENIQKYNFSHGFAVNIKL